MRREATHQTYNGNSASSSDPRDPIINYSLQANALIDLDLDTDRK